MRLDGTGALRDDDQVMSDLAFIATTLLLT